MGVRLLKELWAYQLAQDFKREVYRLIDDSQGASRDFKFKDQLRDSASGVPRNIGEGFRRFGAAEIVHFVNIALGSLEESKINLIDGIDRKYFTGVGCSKAFQLAKRCDKATQNFKKSLEPFIRNRRGRQRPGPARPPKPRNPRMRDEPVRRQTSKKPDGSTPSE
jgi:four helix bundle protein